MSEDHWPWDDLGRSLVNGIAHACQFNQEHERLSAHTMQSCTQATRHGLTLLPRCALSCR